VPVSKWRSERPPADPDNFHFRIPPLWLEVRFAIRSRAILSWLGRANRPALHGGLLVVPGQRGLTQRAANGKPGVPQWRPLKPIMKASYSGISLITTKTSSPPIAKAVASASAVPMSGPVTLAEAIEAS